jgi:hypothetical protein
MLNFTQSKPSNLSQDVSHGEKFGGHLYDRRGDLGGFYDTLNLKIKSDFTSANFLP